MTPFSPARATQVTEDEAPAGESAVDAVKRMNEELAKAATSERAIRKVNPGRTVSVSFREPHPILSCGSNSKPMRLCWRKM